MMSIRIPQQLLDVNLFSMTKLTLILRNSNTVVLYHLSVSKIKFPHFSLTIQHFLKRSTWQYFLPFYKIPWQFWIRMIPPQPVITVVITAFNCWVYAWRATEADCPHTQCKVPTSPWAINAFSQKIWPKLPRFLFKWKLPFCSLSVIIFSQGHW